MIQLTSAQTAWIARQRALGWPNYDRAVYAFTRLEVLWEMTKHPAPQEPERYMQSWYSASRYSGGGIAPEDIEDEIMQIS